MSAPSGKERASVRLTPIDMLNRRFPRAMRGYAPASVEEFLRELADDYEAVLAENARMRERLEGMEREIERFRAMEHTLKEALLLAQKTADETRALAHREAEALQREAQSRAASTLLAVEHRLEALRQQRLRFSREFRAMLQAYLDGLNDASSMEPDVPLPSSLNSETPASHLAPHDSAPQVAVIEANGND